MLGTVAVSGRHLPVARSAVVAAVQAVLAGERRRATISISFVGPQAIRQLNLAWLGQDRSTDVIAFELPQPGPNALGDVYICQAVARRQAALLRVPLKAELLRLVIHGTLHVLGYQHPEGAGRTQSPMWRKQERYLSCVV